MRQLSGDLLPIKGQLAIVASRFNDFIVEQLIRGAVAASTKLGLSESQLTVVSVPGAFEIPFACQQLAQTKRYEGIVALGAIIRGSTPHFDYVANESAKGIAALQLSLNLPMTSGILPCDTIEQAIERAGTKAGNKGYDAMFAIIEMINLMAKIHD